METTGMSGNKGPISLTLTLARPEDAQILLDCYAVIRDNSRMARDAEDEEYDMDSALPENIERMITAASVWVWHQQNRMLTAELEELESMAGRTRAIIKVVEEQIKWIHEQAS